MRRTMVICAMAVSVTAGALADPAPAHAVQVSTTTDSCVRPSDGLARREVTSIRELVTGTGSLDVSSRSTFSLPAMPADSVTLVQDPAVHFGFVQVIFDSTWTAVTIVRS